MALNFLKRFYQGGAEFIRAHFAYQGKGGGKWNTGMME